MGASGGIVQGGWREYPGGYPGNQQQQPQAGWPPQQQFAQFAQQPGMPQQQPQFPGQQVAGQPQPQAPLPQNGQQGNLPKQAPLPWFPPGPPGAPQDGWAPPTGQQQAPQQIQQQVPQPQQQPTGPDLQTRLSGPGVPAELQGRTLADALGIYGGLRNVALQVAQGQQQAPQQAATVPPAAPTAAAQAPVWDWRNPQPQIEAAVARAIETHVAPMLAPMQRQSAMTAMQVARDSVARSVGPQIFAQIEPLVIQRLQGADPAALQSAQMWEIATDSVLGTLARQGHRLGGGMQPAGPQHVGGQPQYAPQNPAPNLNTFFSEQSASGSPVGGGAVTLTAEQDYVRQQLGMTTQDYIAWGGGNRR